jgi:hypothetical protein
MKMMWHVSRIRNINALAASLRLRGFQGFWSQDIIDVQNFTFCAMA